MDFEAQDNSVAQGWWLHEQEESYADYLASYVSNDVHERIVQNQRAINSLRENDAS